MAYLSELPDGFDVDLIGDDSVLQPQALEALREAAVRRAARDPQFFLEKFWHVIDPIEMVWVKFTLRDYQKEDVLWLHEGFQTPRWRAIIGKARQVGQTTLVAGMAMWDVLFHDNHPWVVSSQTDEDAKETLGTRMKDPYLLLPKWLRDRLPALENDSVESMEFSNGSRILSVPSTSRAGRGKVAFGVIFDEAAHAEKAEDVFTAMDPMTYGPFIVISTGNGMGNFYHKTWTDAGLPSSPWAKRFHPWYVVPGRDEKWYNRQKLLYRGREHVFYQEFPADEDEQFAKTGMAVLPVALLREQGHWCEPAFRIDLDLGWDEDEDGWYWRKVLDDGEESANELHIWQLPNVARDERGQPVQKPNYVIFADVAEGLIHGDRTSIVVADANNLEVVATYRGWYPVEDLADLLAVLGEWYHWALIGPERNNMGIVVVNGLRKDHQYPRLFRMPQLAQVPTGDRTARYGWITSGPTKSKMVADFTRAIKEENLILHDERLLEEAVTYIKDGKGGFNASPGNYDDHVVAHMGAWQLVLDVGQYPIIWEDDQEYRPVTWGDMLAIGNIEEEENEVPTGMVDRFRQPVRNTGTAAAFRL